MKKRSWIRQLFTRPVTRAMRKPPHRARLGLGVEVLEDRRLLSIVVNNATDTPVTGQTDLRQAIVLANSTGGAQTITFDPTVFSTPQTISLSGGELELGNTSGAETIAGPSAGVTVNGAGRSLVFQVDKFVTASISGLTITGGNSASNGGGLNNGGGGVLNYGSLALTNCTVSGNSTSGYFGGGVFNNSGTLALTKCIISGNSAPYVGGVWNYYGSLALTNCTVSGNGGGGVGSFGGTATLTNCTVIGNDGGGMGNSVGTATLTNCTISDNSASSGGGVSNSGTATLINCTVSGNSATGSYGSGGGMYNLGTTILANTIIAGNTSHFGGPDVGGYVAFVSQGNNLIGVTDGSSGWVSSDLTGTSAQPLNAVLAPLGNYGGSTQTMALLPGSPAIDAGNNSLIPASVTTDQRGSARIVNGTVDIGAFESQGFTLTPVTGGSPQTAMIGTAFANPLAVMLTANNPIEPVDGGVVSFVAHPAANGASAILPSSAVITGGQAAVTAVPDNADGSYAVVASASGLSASFNLTNAGPVFASLVVNTTSDSLAPGAGLLSLREAISFANYDRSGNTQITFDKHVFAHAQTINLIGGQLELGNTSETETIIGANAGLTVNGGGASRVFQIDANVTATILGLTITGGNSASNGGGVSNLGTLALTNCTVSGNSATGNGGGVDNLGTATLTNSTVSGNSAGNHGGGVDNPGTTTLTNCAVNGNTAANGGGVQNYGSLAMTNCTVSGNSASALDQGGGGVRNGRNSSAMLTNCTLSGNSASYGAGLYGYGGAMLTNCIVSGNSASRGGGGVFNILGTITLTNCTVSGNSALGGGYAFNGGGGLQNASGTIALTNCTVIGNSASGGGSGNAINFGGGGLLNLIGTATLTNCTVSDNSSTLNGGGVSNPTRSINSGLSTVTLTNCTVSGNSAVDGGGVWTAGAANHTYATTTLKNCTVSGNSATGNGGGLDSAYLGRTALTNCSVSGNSASTGGGISNQGTLNVVSSNIIKNQASSAGGGISTTGGSATITDSVINANQVNSSATALGGGIDCENSSLSLANCTVNANQANGATAEGGGIYATDSTVSVQNSNVNGNKAIGVVLGEGGGIYSDNSLLTLLATSIVNGNKASTAYDNVFSM